MTPSEDNKISEYLQLINSSFQIDKLIREKQKSDEIRNYYLTNHLAYLVFHNRKGFMHMGISKNGVYKEEDLLGPLKIINGYIPKINAKNVLEVGAGNGANCAYLAEKNGRINFKGIDLSKPPLKRYKGINNYTQEYGDYHDLGRYPDASFDIIFAIEALNHSSNVGGALAEIHKKLRRKGLLIVFDGYLLKRENELNEEERLAKKLTENAMAVDKFENIEVFEQTIKSTSFHTVKEEDLSLSVLPSLKRFERLALSFFRFPPLTKILKVVLPFDLVKNSIAGLLMPTLVKRKIACYYLHVLEKI